MPVVVFGWSRVSPKTTNVQVLGTGDVVGTVVTVVVGLGVGVGDEVGVGRGEGPDESDEYRS